jgi:alpha-beta hydrolase superfamily lysophospholipase
MPFYQRAALWAAVNTVPWLSVDGQGFEVAVSDNIDALRALGSDPLVLGAVRLDMLDGLVDLMGLALERAALLDLPTLVLYGEREEVVPPEPIEALLEGLPVLHSRLALYPDGYHLLLRDLHAAVVIEDIAAWTADPHAPLVSGLERPIATLRATAPPPDG